VRQPTRLRGGGRYGVEAVRTALRPLCPLYRAGNGRRGVARGAAYGAPRPDRDTTINVTDKPAFGDDERQGLSY